MKTQPTPHHDTPEPQIPTLHQTALSYVTAVPGGCRLASKNAPREREKSAPFAAQESPYDTIDSGGGIESAPELWDDPIDDPGLGRFCPIWRDNLWRDLQFGFF
ncbi:MAG: hypothetical protein U9N36_09250 [Euryarchaeota archaeon]|nr:hypothetical protein [Euryarchaeota archaeon]